MAEVLLSPNQLTALINWTRSEIAVQLSAKSTGPHVRELRKVRAKAAENLVLALCVDPFHEISE